MSCPTHLNFGLCFHIIFEIFTKFIHSKICLLKTHIFLVFMRYAEFLYPILQKHMGQ